MEDKKSQDIRIIDLKKINTSVTDYFVLATGTSNTHIDAISDGMESGMPSELIEKLGSRLKVIGISWNNNIKQIGGNFN